MDIFDAIMKSFWNLIVSIAVLCSYQWGHHLTKKYDEKWKVYIILFLAIGGISFALGLQHGTVTIELDPRYGERIIYQDPWITNADRLAFGFMVLLTLIIPGLFGIVTGFKKVRRQT